MSENIFTELYNRVLSLFGQCEPKEENAKDVACNRLRVVLMQDRTNLTPELLQRMRKELVELLSKYVEMDKEALELNFEQEGEQMALMLSIPVVRAKEESEIEAALKAEDEADEEENESEEEGEETEEQSSEDDDSEEKVSEDEDSKAETETPDNDSDATEQENSEAEQQ